MKTNMTLEEFNKELSKKVLEDFEQYDKGILNNIDRIRNKMCDNVHNFLRGLNEETDNVFMLVEYHSLMKEVVASLRHFCDEKDNNNCIVNVLKQIREFNVNQLLRADVKFNSTSTTHNMCKIRKVEAFQNLIHILDMKISECERKYDMRYKSLVIKD